MVAGLDTVRDQALIREVDAFRPRSLYHGLDADIGHGEIVLNALATEMGIGYAYNPNSNSGGYFTLATVTFARAMWLHKQG